MRLRLPPKNKNQGIYWVRYYLDHVDKPQKQIKPSKQTEYRALLVEVRNCFEQQEYPDDIQILINEIDRVLLLKRITSSHMKNITAQIDFLTNKYK
jgi:hypothetical protein